MRLPLRPAHEAAIAHVRKAASFFCLWEPFSVALDLEPDWVEPRVIHAQVPLDLVAIPAIEAWIAEPIPLAAILSVRFFLGGHVAATVERPLTIEKLHDA